MMEHFAQERKPIVLTDNLKNDIVRLGSMLEQDTSLFMALPKELKRNRELQAKVLLRLLRERRLFGNVPLEIQQDIHMILAEIRQKPGQYIEITMEQCPSCMLHDIKLLLKVNPSLLSSVFERMHGSSPLRVEISPKCSISIVSTMYSILKYCPELGLCIDWTEETIRFLAAVPDVYTDNEIYMILLGSLHVNTLIIATDRIQSNPNLFEHFMLMNNTSDPTCMLWLRHYPTLFELNPNHGSFRTVLRTRYGPPSTRTTTPTLDRNPLLSTVWSDRNLVLAYFRAGGAPHEYIDSRFQNDPELCLAMLVGGSTTRTSKEYGIFRNSHWQWMMMPHQVPDERFGRDRIMMLQNVEIEWNRQLQKQCQWVSETLRGDKDFMLQAVEAEWRMAWNASSTLLGDDDDDDDDCFDLLVTAVAIHGDAPLRPFRKNVIGTHSALFHGFSENARFLERIHDLIKLHDIFTTTFLLAVHHSHGDGKNPSCCVLPMINCGLDNSLKEHIADFVGVPRNRQLKHLRQALAKTKMIAKKQHGLWHIQ